MSSEKNNIFWAEKAARETVERFPDEKMYTCAAGISPSGKVHFGNFRDLMTTCAVAYEIQKLGKKSRVLFSWDEFDRFRKVPSNVPQDFEEHIGKPLVDVPDPNDKAASYAKSFEQELEEATKRLGLTIEFVYQAEQYRSGAYDEGIIKALRARKEIAQILISHMSEKGKANRNLDEARFIEEYYPIRVYSRFTGKDNTIVLDYDGDTSITYQCVDTKREETVDLRKEHIAKLGWKIDWPMRWQHEGVRFEPGGSDHASPGSSFIVSSEIAQKIFGYEPPSFVEYGFVGIQGQGTKMSGSKGNAVTPLQLLEIYQPSLLKWIYLRKNPKQTFSLAFNTELYRQYDEFDRTVSAGLSGTLDSVGKKQLALSFEGVDDSQVKDAFPFRQAVALGQIVQWDVKKVKEILYSLEQQYDVQSIEQRLPYAKNWLETYNPEEMIVLREDVNSDYVKTMSDTAKEQVLTLRKKLEEGVSDIKELEVLVYAIPKNESLSQKENAPLQRAFFKDVYNLLIGKNTGPRLSTFLWAVDRSTVLRLLAI